MDDLWYYTRQGQRIGPVSTEQLKQLAAAGQLAADDHIWNQGMASWTPARDINGLIPSAVVPTPEAPPPIPSMLSETPSSVALWNPQYIPVAGFCLTPAFGAWLLAENWKSLGNPVKAKQAMYWLWGQLGLAATSCLFTPLGGLIIPLYVAWVFFELLPQAKHIKATVGDRFVHRTWGKPVRIALGCLVAYMALMALLLTVIPGEHPNIHIVKTGSMSSYPNVPVGKAINAFLSNPQWVAVQGNDGNNYVNVKGGASMQGKPVRVHLQFRVDSKAQTFQVNALEVNELPQNGFMAIGLMNAIFRDYKP